MTNNILVLVYALIAIVNPGPETDAVAVWFEIALSLAMLIGMAGVFAKAGRPWYAAFIPIYAELTLLGLMEKPWWWLVLLLIPCVGIIVQIVMLVLLLKQFDKGTGWLFGMIFVPFIMLPILGFGGAQYHAPFHSTRRRSQRT